jgi:hypothetical protein
MMSEKQKRKEAPKPPLTFIEELAVIFRLLVIAPITGIFRVGRWTAKQAWRATAWSSGMAWSVTKWGAGLAWQGVKLPFRLVSWLFGYGTLPDFENIYQREAYLRVKRTYRRRFWRNLHTLVFFLFNGALAAQMFFQWIQVINEIRGYNWFNNQLFGVSAFVFMWSLVLLAHFAFVRAKETEDEALTASLENYRGYNPPEKRKHVAYEEVDEYADEQAYYEEMEARSRLEEQAVYEEPEWQERPTRRTKSRRS